MRKRVLGKEDGGRKKSGGRTEKRVQSSRVLLGGVGSCAVTVTIIH